jgi:hypothetical protein
MPDGGGRKTGFLHSGVADFCRIHYSSRQAFADRFGKTMPDPVSGRQEPMMDAGIERLQTAPSRVQDNVQALRRRDADQAADRASEADRQARRQAEDAAMERAAEDKGRYVDRRV